MLLGGELSEFFVLPGLSVNEARDVRGAAGRGGETTTEDFGLVPDDNFVGEVFPCLRCLPMGFSWAFHLAQRCHEFEAAAVLPNVDLLRDRRPFLPPYT